MACHCTCGQRNPSLVCHCGDILLHDESEHFYDMNGHHSLVECDIYDRPEEN